MSRAFVKEEEGQTLSEIGPGMNALIHYLSNDNNGVRVYEKRHFFSNKHKKVLHEMSNGLIYALNEESRWYIVWD